MKILVTGGGGYIGSALSIELAKQGHEVRIIDGFFHGLDSLTTLNRFNLKISPVKLFVAGDNLLYGHDVIFHLAAIAGSIACEKVERNLVSKYNVKNTEKLANLLSNELLIFTSTSAMYGTISRYTMSKMTAEKSVLAYENSITIRLPTIFGVSPCMRPGILVNDLVCSAVKNGYIVLWNKDAIRSWMSLGDCVSGLINLIKNPDRYYGRKKVWDINGNFLSKYQIVETIRSITGCEVFYSNRKGKYTQNFNKVSPPKFKYLQGINSTIKELVKYYEGTKHSSAIDWSK